MELVEPDTPIYPFDIVTQQGATWGLGAISQKAPTNANASLLNGFEYRYDENGGEGTFAYVVDTGVWVDNPDFEGRAELGYTVYPDIPNEDSSGHGTHVAGTIASKTWGVAKKARVISVKVIAPNQVSCCLGLTTVGICLVNFSTGCYVALYGRVLLGREQHHSNTRPRSCVCYQHESR